MYTTRNLPGFELPRITESARITGTPFSPSTRRGTVGGVVERSLLGLAADIDRVRSVALVLAIVADLRVLMG